ncbi:MAG: hypothetical protein LBD58_01165 [Treponema sp.]|nr:hypothetical protein [Treponema sp.]
MKPERYTTLLKFFRSNAFDIDSSYQKPIAVFVQAPPPKTKEGRGMPAIERPHQESRRSGKGAFIEGRLFGFISMIIPGFDRSMPVMAGIQESKAKTGGEILAVQMARQGEMAGKPGVLLLDAFFQ